MKKITTLLVLLTLSLTTNLATFAAKAVNIDEQKNSNAKTVKTLKATAAKEDALFYNKVEMLTERYINNFRDCKPLHINQNIDFFGLKIGYSIDINGWTENKCGYYMTGKISSIGPDIREVFDIKISDEDIAKFAPIIKCDFTQDQLNILVDAVISNYNKKADIMTRMLQDPTDKYNEKLQNKLTPEEEKLVAMLAGGTACSIPNLNELIKQIPDIMPAQQTK